jgi:hypothetical protein
MTTEEKYGAGAGAGISAVVLESTIRSSSFASVVEGQSLPRFLRRVFIVFPLLVVSLSMCGRRTLDAEPLTRSLNGGRVLLP